MRNEKHTAGPWVISASEKCRYTIFPGNEHGRPRALCSIAWVQSWNDTEDDEANARLIAAAPKMLTTLRSIARWCADPSDQRTTSDFEDELFEVIGEATEENEE